MSAWEGYIDSQLLLKDGSGQQTRHSPINFGAIITLEGAIVADQGFHITQDEAYALVGSVKKNEFRDEFKCASAFELDGSVGAFSLGGNKYVVSRGGDGIALSSRPCMVPVEQQTGEEERTGCVIGVSNTLVILGHVYNWGDSSEVQTAHTLVNNLKDYLESTGY